MASTEPGFIGSYHPFGQAKLVRFGDVVAYLGAMDQLQASVKEVPRNDFALDQESSHRPVDRIEWLDPATPIIHQIGCAPQRAATVLRATEVREQLGQAGVWHTNMGKDPCHVARSALPFN
jgi:hypothetical protein